MSTRLAYDVAYVHSKTLQMDDDIIVFCPFWGRGWVGQSHYREADMLTSSIVFTTASCCHHNLQLSPSAQKTEGHLLYPNIHVRPTRP